MKKSKMFRSLIMMIGLSLTIIITGCSNGSKNIDLNNSVPAGSSSGGTENPAYEISVGGLLGANNGFGLYMASKQGYFSNRDIKADIHTEWTAGAPMLEALPSGTWDIGWIGATACNTGVLEYGCSIIGVGGIDNTMQIFVREDSDVYAAGKGNCQEFPEIYGSADTLKGKTILCEKGTMHYLNLCLYLDKFGLTEEDVNIVHTELQSAFQAFKAGQGDMISVCSPVTADCITSGYKCVETMDDIGAAQPCMIITTPEYAEAHRDEVVAFLKACMDVGMYLNDSENEESSVGLYQEFQKEEVGVETSKEDCSLVLSQISWYDSDDMKDLAEVNGNGVSGLETLYDCITGYFVELGKISTEDKETIMKAVDVSYLQEAVRSY